VNVKSFLGGKNGRFILCWFHPAFPGHQLGLYFGLRTPDGGKGMNWLYLIVGLITVALFVYLVLALLKPEWFG
jgi:K+-transporting ATPase KdpF subunit